MILAEMNPLAQVTLAFAAILAGVVAGVVVVARDVARAEEEAPAGGPEPCVYRDMDGHLCDFVGDARAAVVVHEDDGEAD